MSRLACTVFLAMWVASHASAEIFKCVGKNGLDLYQNFPCQFETMGWVPDAPGPKATSTPAAAAATETKTIVAKSTQPREVRVGMTAEDVRAIWGEPTDWIQEEPGQGGRFELWTYAGSRSVRFDHRGRVSAFQP